MPYFHIPVPGTGRVERQRSMTQVALVDDHVLLRKGLATLVGVLGYQVMFEADNGEDCIKKISAGLTPDLVLMDISMPVLDGIQATAWITENHPGIPVLALSMNEDEDCVLRMLRSGARGYLLKDASPEELRLAIEAVLRKGVYYSPLMTESMFHLVAGNGTGKSVLPGQVHLTGKEIEFLRLACTELAYKEIAARMSISPRTVDTYRDNLFSKLHIRSRTGLALYAIRHGLVRL